MELGIFEQEMARARKALSAESYGSDEAKEILGQMSKLADMYKTISEADTNRNRVDDAREKDVKELEIREAENQAHNELEAKRLELDTEKMNVEKLRLEIEKEKASLEKEKLESTNEADKRRSELDEKRLKLDELKAEHEHQDNDLNRVARKRETILGISRDVVLAGLQIGVGIASSITALNFGQQILHFEETGAVVSWTGKNIFPKILGKIK